MTPMFVLDRLIAAGLGDVPQNQITRQQYEAAIQRQVVKRPSPRWVSSRERYQKRRVAYLEIHASAGH